VDPISYRLLPVTASLKRIEKWPLRKLDGWNAKCPTFKAIVAGCSKKIGHLAFQVVGR